MKGYIKIPWISFNWKMIDLRRWYYVWIDGIKCDWWSCEDEVDSDIERYEKKGFEIKVKKVPWYKSMFR